MKRKTLAAVIVSAGLVLGGTSIHQEISNNQILLTNHSSNSKNTTTHYVKKSLSTTNNIQNTNENLAFNTNIQIAYIGSGNAPALANAYNFAATTKNNETNAPLTFASPLQKKLYEYLSVPTNQALTMKTAINLHNGNPANTCVLFQSSALRANGFNIPLSTSYTTEFMGNLLESGWQRHTDFNNLQPGDICFASTYHTFMFMGWYNKAEKIAYVMGNESFMSSKYYRQRYLHGLASAPSNDNNGQFKATSYYTYNGKPNKHLILSGKIIGGTVNVMSKLNGNGYSLGQVYYGDNVAILEQQGHYFKIDKNGLIGWIYAVNILPNGILENYLAPTTQNNKNTINKGNNSKKTFKINTSNKGKTIQVTSPVGLWLLGAPSTSSTKITVMPFNTNLKILGQTENWTKVDYNGTIGWCYTKYTKVLDSSKPMKPTIKPIVRPIAKPVAKPTKPITQNKPVVKPIVDKILGTTTITSPVGLWQLSAPSAMNGKHITIIPYNAKVNVYAEKNGWYEVEYNGVKGWSFAKYTSGLNNTTKTVKPLINKPIPSPTPIISNNNSKIVGTTTITSTIGLWQLSSPSMNGKHITVIPYNTKVNVYAEKDGWYEVEYNGVKGWSFAKYTSGLNKNLIAQNPTQNNQQIKEVISPVGLWLLQAPYLSATGIEIMPYKANLKVLAQNGNWTKVDYNGTIGWCYTQYTQNI